MTLVKTVHLKCSFLILNTFLSIFMIVCVRNKS